MSWVEDDDDDDDDDNNHNNYFKDKDKDDEEDEYTYVDNLFKKVELESKQILEKLTKNAKQKTGDPIVGISGFTSNANILKLREVCLLKKWDRVIQPDARERLQQEQNVIRTHYLTEAELHVPYDEREETTARFFLYSLKQEGLFSDLHSTEVFTLESTGQQLLLCSTVSRRIDPELLLTGNYVFQLTSPLKVWDSENIDDKSKYTDGICKIMHDGPTILTEKVIFRNFYFDVVKHGTREPLMSLNFL